MFSLYFLYVSFTRPGPTTTGLPGNAASVARYDGQRHWIVNTDTVSEGKKRRRNCKMCLENGKRDAKTLFMCEKCSVPLHALCFKESIFSIVLCTHYIGVNGFYKLIGEGIQLSCSCPIRAWELYLLSNQSLLAQHYELYISLGLPSQMTKCLIEILYFDLYFSIFDFVFLYFCSLYTVNFDTNTNKFVCV